VGRFETLTVVVDSGDEVKVKLHAELPYGAT
jgi:hypothetical protein